MTAIATQLAAEHGAAPRKGIGQEEITERLLYPLINEGLKTLDEGIAYRPGDIDLVWTAGYGFPDHRGGPMWMADTIGLPVIAQRLAHHAAARGDAFGYWTAARRLKELEAKAKGAS